MVFSGCPGQQPTRSVSWTKIGVTRKRTTHPKQTTPDEPLNQTVKQKPAGCLCPGDTTEQRCSSSCKSVTAVQVAARLVAKRVEKRCLWNDCCRMSPLRCAGRFASNHNKSSSILRGNSTVRDDASQQIVSHYITDQSSKTRTPSQSKKLQMPSERRFASVPLNIEGLCDICWHPDVTSRAAALSK